MQKDVTVLELPGKPLPLGLELPPGLTYEEWRDVGRGLQAVNRSQQWWIGDWLNYGEANYGETYAQALEETGSAYQSLAIAKYVASRFEIFRRRKDLSWSHHAAAASLSPELQDELLDAAEVEGWNEKQLRTAVSMRRRTDRHKAIAAGARQRDLLAGTFALLYADPPWTFETHSELGKEISPEQHYPTMTLGDICALEIDGRTVPEVAEKHAGLFLWCTSSNVHLALEVMKAWDFEYKTHLVWDKMRTGTGYIFLNQHELLLYGSRGNFPAPDKIASSVYREKRTTHSAKPAGVRRILESMYPYFAEANRLELFARGEVKGWSTWGNQA